MDVKEYLDFRKMVTPLIIKIVFWIGVGLSILLGLGLIIAGVAASGEASRYGYQGGAPGGVLVLIGLLVIVFGPLIVRLNCELTMVFFKIYETLVEIRNNGGHPALPAFAPGQHAANQVPTHR